MAVERISVAHSDCARGAAREHLQDLMDVVAREVAEHGLTPDTIISVGRYGHVTLAQDGDPGSDNPLLLRDVEAGAKNADSFLAKYMALRGFDHMDEGVWESALECFDFSLMLKPTDAVLMQALAQVKAELSRLAKSDDEASRLLMEMFADLIKPIELAPDRPEAYIDLQHAIQGFHPAEGITQEHRKWRSEIIRRALAHKTQNADALKAREQLGRLSAA